MVDLSSLQKNGKYFHVTTWNIFYVILVPNHRTLGIIYF